MDVGVRLRGWWDDLRDSLWLLPAMSVVLAVSLAALLGRFEPLPSWYPELLAYGGSAEGARSVLSALSTGTITVVGLVFSLTVVSLQVASGQFTPRLLRTFLRDRKTQVVLSGMVASAVFDIAVLGAVRGEGENGEAFVPALAVAVALLWGLAAAGLLVFFLHHVTSHLRVDVVMRGIARESIGLLEGDHRPELPDREPDEPPPGAHVTAARLDGYLQTVDIDRAAGRLRSLGVHARVRPTIGTWVTEGTVLAWWWLDEHRETTGQDAWPDPTEVDDVVHAHVHLGPDRTESEDITFGLRQLSDIALRALSTGVNDPTTAVQAIEQMAAILGQAARHPLGVVTVEDDAGVRVAFPRPTFAALLALAVDQVRENGKQDTDVQVALLGLLTDLAELVSDSFDRRHAVAKQVDRVEAATDLDDQQDRARVARAVAQARAALDEGLRPTGVTEAG